MWDCCKSISDHSKSIWDHSKLMWDDYKSMLYHPKSIWDYFKSMWDPSISMLVHSKSLWDHSKSMLDHCKSMWSLVYQCRIMLPPSPSSPYPHPNLPPDQFKGSAQYPTSGQSISSYLLSLNQNQYI